MRIYTEVALCVALGVLPGVAIAAADGLYVGGNVSIPALVPHTF
jgi:hypothetical protein